MSIILSKSNEKKFISEFRKIISSLSDNEVYMLFINSRTINIILENNLFFSNLDIISKKISDLDIITCIRTMYGIDNYYVKMNKLKLFSYYFSEFFYKRYIPFCINNMNTDINDIINYIKVNNVNLYSNDLMKYLISKGYKKIVYDNLDMFINNSCCLIDLKNKVKNYNIDNDENCAITKINTRMDKNPDMLIREIISPRFDYDEFEKEKILPYLKRFMYELCVQEKVNYHDIKYVTEGDYSYCYRIGDKFFKIGDKRETFNINNNKRFLQPLRREEIQKMNGEFLFCLEVNEAVDTNNITEDDVYFVYKELREEGILWADSRVDNLGRLLKDNKIYFDGVNYVDKSGTGFLTNAIYTLKKGDLVIIDTDYIFDEKDMNYAASLCGNFRKYEEKYQEELDNKKGIR